VYNDSTSLNTTNKSVFGKYEDIPNCWNAYLQNEIHHKEAIKE